MSTTSTYIQVKNPLNWLKWILHIIAFMTLFVIVTNGHTQMYQYTQLYLDDSVKSFFRLTEMHVQFVALFVLVVLILLLVVVDYCVWVRFDKFKYKVVIVLLAVVVNIFWWNFNQESFMQKKVEQLATVAPPELRAENTPYDEQIAFLQEQLKGLSRELDRLGLLDSSVYYVVIRSRAKRQTQINEERFLLIEQLNELQEKRDAAIAEILLHNQQETVIYKEAQVQAAAVGQQIGRGIEVFLFCLMAVLHVLGNKTKRVATGGMVTETYNIHKKNKTYTLEDNSSETLVAATGDIIKLPSAKRLGVSERRYDKFSKALPDLLRIARNDGEGLNEYCRQYCDENPEVKISTLKSFYSEIKNNLGEPAQAPLDAKDKGNVLEDMRNKVVTWYKNVAPSGQEAARDIF